MARGGAVYGRGPPTPISAEGGKQFAPTLTPARSSARRWRRSPSSRSSCELLHGRNSFQVETRSPTAGEKHSAAAGENGKEILFLDKDGKRVDHSAGSDPSLNNIAYKYLGVSLIRWASYLTVCLSLHGRVPITHVTDYYNLRRLCLPLLVSD
jgi:hypothetical protein